MAMVQLLTAHEAASQARISVQLLKQQIAAGTGPAVTRLGNGHSSILVREDALEEWIKQRTAPAGAAPQSAGAS